MLQTVQRTNVKPGPQPTTTHTNRIDSVLSRYKSHNISGLHKHNVTNNVRSAHSTPASPHKPNKSIKPANHSVDDSVDQLDIITRRASDAMLKPLEQLTESIVSAINKQQHNTSHTQHDHNSIHVLSNTEQQLRGQVDELQHSLHSAQQKLSEINEQYHATQQLLSTEQQRVTSLDAQHKMIQADNDRLQKQIDSLTQQNTAQQSTIDTLQQTITQHNDNDQSAQQRVDHLTNKLRDKQSQLSQVLDDMDYLRDAYNQVKHDNLTMKSIQSQHESTVAELNDKHTQQFNTLQKQNDKLVEQVAALQSHHAQFDPVHPHASHTTCSICQSHRHAAITHHATDCVQLLCHPI